MRDFRQWLRWRREINRTANLRRAWKVVRTSETFGKIATSGWWVTGIDETEKDDLLDQFQSEQLADLLKCATRCCVFQVCNREEDGRTGQAKSERGKSALFIVDADTNEMLFVGVGTYVV